MFTPSLGITVLLFGSILTASFHEDNHKKKMEALEIQVRHQIKNLLQIPNPKLLEDMLVDIVMHAEHRAAIQAELNGILTQQKDTLSLYRQAVVVRSHIEYLEDLLFPKDQVNPRGRFDRWMKILNSNHPYARKIRENVESLYKYDNPIKSHEAFARSLQTIYGDLCIGRNSPHNLLDESVIEALRSDIEQMKKLCGFLGIRFDEDKQLALKIIVQPFDIDRKDTVDSLAQDEDYSWRYVVIRPKYGALESGITQEDIRKFFSGFPIKSLDLQSRAQIVVEFNDENEAIKALNICPSLLKDSEVTAESSRKPKSGVFKNSN